MPKEITTKSALHFHERPIPTNWDLNIYRGCTHKCKYCFAQYSHQYLESEDFFGDIYVKTNIAQVLDRELSRKKWKNDQINIGGVTDSYQPWEKHYEIMPQVLKIIEKHKTPVIICTKSHLILRDIELISSIASVTDVDITVSITTMDEDLRKILEPGAVTPSIKRIEMLKKFKEGGCRTHILLMPILPYLTDSEENLEKIFSLCHDQNIDSVIAGPLNLKGSTKTGFLSFIRDNFPDIYQNYQDLYQTGYVKKDYSVNLNGILKELRKKYNFFYNHQPPDKVNIIKDEKKSEYEQLSLFDNI